jgi:2-dehydropantoate 2-reductase
VTTRWHILGAGAIGRLLACKIKRCGMRSVLVFRDGVPHSHSQVLRESAGVFEHTLEATSVGALAPNEIQGLFVTTKANHAVAAVESVLPALALGAPVILLHNGMGVLESLEQAHSELSLFAGTTTEGAYLDGSTLVHAGEGDTVIGRQGEPAPDWFAPLTAGEERFLWEENIDDALWKKLLVNCAINPLTALHRCRNGALLDNPGLRAEVELLCEELAAVCAARGNRRAANCVLDWVLSVIQHTAANRSSMLQDVEQGRETEIEYITGYLLREAGRLGIPCPHHQQLYAQIQAIT